MTTASVFQGVLVTNGWEVLFLVVPPVLSFCYALAAAIFVTVWGESTLASQVGALIPRNTLCVVALSVALNPASFVYTQSHSSEAGGSEEQPERDVDVVRLICAMVCFWAASFYLIRETRIEVVEGGSAPPMGAETLSEDTSSSSSKQDMVIAVTGANSGIGQETVRQLYQHYDQLRDAYGTVTILLACRNTQDGQRAIREVAGEEGKDTGPVQLKVVELDLASLDSVRRAAKEIKTKYSRVDTLICNAGVMVKDQQTTVDGYELVFQANYLGHYLLTRLLLDDGDDKSGKRKTRSKQRQQKLPYQRVLWITSSTYKMAKEFSLEDPFCQNGIRSYSLFGQYAYSKLAQILFIRQLARRCSIENKEVFCAAIHPGLVRTNVVRNMHWYLLWCNTLFAAVLQTLQKTPAQGAWATFYGATMPVVNDKNEFEAIINGLYWVNRLVQPLNTFAQDDVAAAELWNKSAKWVGLD